MSREELLKYVCYTNFTTECSACGGRFNCQDCKDAINPLLDEYEQQIRADAIEECLNLCRRMGNNTYFTDDWLRKFVQKLEGLKE